MTWHTDAACHPSNRPESMTHATWTARWFPPAAPYGKAQVAQLAAICATCPVRGDCHADAMADTSVGGYRAGMREEDRRRLAPARVGGRAVEVPEGVRAEVAELAWDGAGPTEIARATGLPYTTAHRHRLIALGRNR